MTAFTRTDDLRGADFINTDLLRVVNGVDSATTWLTLSSPSRRPLARARIPLGCTCYTSMTWRNPSLTAAAAAAKQERLGMETV